MKKIIFLLIICFSINAYSQPGREVLPIVTPQGYTIRQLSSKGISNLYNNVSNITSINPASLNQFQKTSVGISYQFESELNPAWFVDIGSHRINTVMPQSAGGIIPYNNFRFGIGIGQVYNSALDYGNLEIRTIENPEGTGIYYSPDHETTIYNYSLVFSYSIKNFLSEKNELSVGAKYNLNRLHYYTYLLNVGADVTDYSSSFGVGAVLKINISEYKNLRFGLSFESEISFSKLISYEDSGNLLVPPNDSNFVFIKESFPLTAKTPSRLKFDFGLDASHQLKLSGNITKVFWNVVSDNVNNQIEFSASGVYSFNNFSPSLGFYYTDRNFKEDFFGINDKMDAFFITAGLEININNFDVDLAVADSHLFSGDYRKQTIGKIGLGFHL